MLRNLFRRAAPQPAEPRSLSPISPLNAVIARELARTPAVNLLLPWVNAAMTGGPNTALNLACHVAARGVPLRVVSCDQSLPDDTDAVRRYMAALTGASAADIELVSGADRKKSLRFGADDLFIATYFTTAHYLTPILPQIRRRDFVYVIQDFEPAFFPWSSNFAWALETYGMNFRGVINEQFLADYLCREQVGRFADPAFIGNCATFQPALDRRLFYPQAQEPGPRRLLFYGRPFAARNMFELGHDALNIALHDPVFQKSAWEFLSIGGEGHVQNLPLEGGRVLRAAPWRDYAGYAELLRQSDLLLGLMLSPHTSYPVLEVAACGGQVVTSSFATKTAQGLAAISERIIGCQPTVGAVVTGLVEAARRIETGYDRTSPVNLPATWNESLAGAADMVVDMFAHHSA